MYILLYIAYIVYEICIMMYVHILIYVYYMLRHAQIQRVWEN
jgi:hypothetical protein